jgi:hypothetical protein
MPSNWLYIDTNFPSFTQKESVNDKVETMQDYLFMLVEQLRYTLHNLDLSNMNKTATDEFVKQITDPIYGEIKDAEGNITQVALMAEGLAARIGDAEGNITQLQATAQGLSASISNLNGSVTNLTADVNGIRATVRTKIDATQAQSIFDQSATGFTLGATSGENGTIFKLNYNGVQVASTGTVDLHVKAVNIDGTLTAGALRGNTIALIDNNGNTIGGFTLADTTTSTGLGMTTTWGGIKIQPAGNIFLQAGTGGDITIQNGLVQLGSAALCLATPSFGPSKPSGAGVAGQLYIQLVS